MGVVTVSTSRVVSVMLCDQSRLEVQLHGLAVHAHVGDASAGRHDGLADVEGRRDAHGLDGHVDAGAAREVHDLLHRLAVATRSTVRVAPRLPATCRRFVVEVDHDDLGRRVELRRQQRGQADGPGAHDGHRVARLHLAVQHAALEAGGEDVAQHDAAPPRPRRAGRA